MIRNVSPQRGLSHLRILFSSSIAILLLISSVSCISANNSNLIENHWAEQSLQRWIELEWIPYAQDGHIRADDPITRAEFAAFVNQAFQYSSSTQQPAFTDLSTNHWAYGHIAIAYEIGYMKGDSANSIAPDRPASRQEIAVMLSQILKLDHADISNLSLYTDSPTIAHWAQPAVSSLLKAHIMRGDTNGAFRPRAEMTRAEAIIAIDAASSYLSNYESASPTLELPKPTRLKVSANQRFLTYADNTPFFWLGDTAWELAHRLDRSEVNKYLHNVADNGMNIVQFVALAELAGLTEPNAYGDLPLIDKNPSLPDVTPGNRPNMASEYDYWDHVDYIVHTANSLGIYVAILPTWGSYLWENTGQKADPIFTVSNAYEYGKWIGQRYAQADNLIWVLGGDRIPDTNEKITIIRNMANGIRDGGGTQLKTYHPWGGKSSSDYFHPDEWLDFNSFQSGHPSRNYPNYKYAIADYARLSNKPTIDIEPRYEHLPIKFNLELGRFNGYDARQAAYWSVFSGAFGHTYGHNSIWQMYDGHHAPTIHVSTYWTDALHAEGRTTLRWLKSLIESRTVMARVPDPSMIVDARSGADHIVATRGVDYAFIYSSTGLPFEIRLGKISGEYITAHWYNPRTGASTFIHTFTNYGNRTFTPPTRGIGNDWVLVLDDSSLFENS